MSIGFGKKVFHGKEKLQDLFYGEWEMGTYYTAWRVIQYGEILCGSQDSEHSTNDLDKRLKSIAFGSVTAIYSISIFDIRIEFDIGICIEVLGSISDDDEIFHIFGPNDIYIEYKIRNGWKVGKSNEPWQPQTPSEGRRAG